MMGNNDQNFRERLPSHYCAECTQVLFDEADVCPNCTEAEPGDGWPSIQDGFDPWLGRVLDGRYVLTRSVGKGAAGSVYKANSVAIARDFAVKIIDFKDESSGIDGNQARARLHREIEAIGRLKNPHVVPFYEVLELYDQFVGVVMDYVEGRTLEEVVMRDGPLPIKRALVILRQIANGTHEAHEAGMIHRDLKPDNIMVERMPAGDDFAHILDFGIVRLDDGVSMTQGFLGTPLYASPEQAMAGEIDRRSDIYSLGAILFFVLTGNPPFMSDNVYQILQAHVRKQAPRLSEAFPHRAFPAELEDLVEEMLAKSPTRRPQTLSDVIDRIDEMLDLPVVHEDAPESFEFPILGEQNATLNGDAYDTDGLREDSASVFESNERDRTGPKAAIFRRGGSGNVSRGSVRRLIDQHREKRRASVDTVYQGNTGAHTLGITVPGRAAFGACAPAGDLMLATDDGQVLVVRGGEVTTIDDVRDVRSCALNDTDALVGTGDGHVLAVEPDGSTSVLFQDIREKPMTALALGDDNRTWLAGSESGRLYRCSPTAGRRVWLRIQDGPPIDAVAIADKGNMFAVARRHGELEISSIASPKQPYARIPATGGIRGLTFSEDGHLLAVLDEDDTIQVYLVEQGIPVHTLKDAENHVLTLGFRGEDLLGYFQSDQKMYARHLDRELERSE